MLPRASASSPTAPRSDGAGRRAETEPKLRESCNPRQTSLNVVVKLHLSSDPHRKTSRRAHKSRPPEKAPSAGAMAAASAAAAAPCCGVTGGAPPAAAVKSPSCCGISSSLSLLGGTNSMGFALGSTSRIFFRTCSSKVRFCARMDKFSTMASLKSASSSHFSTASSSPFERSRFAIAATSWYSVARSSCRLSGKSSCSSLGGATRRPQIPFLGI
mmetsp:Transcript_18349/g.59598  ORF Transcript_18349/g.59598 Transcript_18349/m.59598 type:complete len:215 (+) Transcript_18349:115-759(+)